VPGIVFGILLTDGSVDEDRCKILIDLSLSFNMKSTFHRAFDMTRNPFEALEVIVSLKFGMLH
jgi:copper homeostasis protein